MKIQIHEEKFEPPVDIQRTAYILLAQGEYDELKTALCKGKGWNLDYPRTVNVHSITLTGNYKWMPASDVEFHVKIEEQKKDPITEA
jgi:hypothetical protein